MASQKIKLNTIKWKETVRPLLQLLENSVEASSTSSSSCAGVKRPRDANEENAAPVIDRADEENAAPATYRAVVITP